MGADLDYEHPDVIQEAKNWAEWYLEFTDVDGFRVDAVKHIKYGFLRGWVEHLKNISDKNIFVVGEFWEYNVEKLHQFIVKTGGRLHLFDAPLHLNFYKASRESGFNGAYDMRRLFDHTLLKDQPSLAVTLVENHDTQPLQALESPVEYWFKPLAYAAILLRQEGYPCVFCADYFGATYSDKGYDIHMLPVKKLKELIKARKLFAYGYQHNYIDHPNTIGWTREGDEKHPGSGCAVIMTNGSDGYKWMYAGKRNTKKKYIDFLDYRTEIVNINSDGWGKFSCNAGSVSVWVDRNNI